RELSEGEQILFATKDCGKVTRWTQGEVLSNRKDGTYDVRLHTGVIERVVRRADLLSRHEAPLTSAPNDSPAAIYDSDCVIDNPSSPGSEKRLGRN
ncbi:unnamed protein product, partial [Laminaria digitata]